MYFMDKIKITVPVQVQGVLQTIFCIAGNDLIQ